MAIQAFKTNQSLQDEAFNQRSGVTLTLYGNNYIDSTATFKYVTDQSNCYIARSIPDVAFVTGLTSAIRNTGVESQVIFRGVSGITGASNFLYDITGSTVIVPNLCISQKPELDDENYYILTWNSGSSKVKIINASNNGIGWSNIVNGSTVIGCGTISANYDTYYNTFVGVYAGATGNTLCTGGTYGIGNIAVGYKTLPNVVCGNYNIAIGASSLYNNSGGTNSIGIGYLSGFLNQGDNNVFIGACAGFNEIGSNKLYIESSSGNTSNALIYGEFDNDVLKLNACTYIKCVGDGNSNDSILTWDSNTCSIRKVPYISGGTSEYSITGATNGLSKVCQTVKLGGVLIEDTIINVSGSCLIITGGSTTKINTFNTQIISEKGCLITNYGVGGNSTLLANCGFGLILATCTETGETASFIIGGGGGACFTDNGLPAVGIQYACCYSTGFTSDCSLVDKGYVDYCINDAICLAVSGITGITSNSIINATNGLTKIGQTAYLGGSLTGNTTLTFTGTCFTVLNNLSFGLYVDDYTVALGDYNGSGQHYIYASSGGAEINQSDSSYDSTNYFSITEYEIGTQQIHTSLCRQYSERIYDGCVETIGCYGNSNNCFILYQNENGCFYSTFTDDGIEQNLGEICIAPHCIVMYNSYANPTNGYYELNCIGTLNNGYRYLSILSNYLTGGTTCVLSEIRLSSNTITVRGTENFGGIKYSDDYSINYNNRSLVDKEYVDKAITGSSTGEKNNIYCHVTVTGDTILNSGSSYVILVNHTSPVTITLPASPIDGQVFRIKDISNCALINNITINRNGYFIDGYDEDALINTNNGAFELISKVSNSSWYILSFVI